MIAHRVAGCLIRSRFDCEYCTVRQASQVAYKSPADGREVRAVDGLSKTGYQDGTTSEGRHRRIYTHRYRIAASVPRIRDSATTAYPIQNLLKLASSSRLASSAVAAMCCGESGLRSAIHPSNLSVVCRPTLSRKTSKLNMVHLLCGEMCACWI
jgi:hypothetical protein